MSEEKEEGPIVLPEYISKCLDEKTQNDFKEFVSLSIKFIDARAKISSFVHLHWESYVALMSNEKLVKNILELFLPDELRVRASLLRQFYKWPIEDVPENLKESVLLARTKSSRGELSYTLESIFKLLRPLYPASEVLAYDNLSEMRKMKRSEERKAKKEMILSSKSQDTETVVCDFSEGLSGVSTNLIGKFKEERKFEETFNKLLADTAALDPETELSELDPETGEIIKGEEIGKVGEKRDLVDEAEDDYYEAKEVVIQKRKKLKQCYDFIEKRLDYYLSHNVDIEYITMRDPFVKKSVIVNDILEDVKVDMIIDLTGDDEELSEDEDN